MSSSRIRSRLGIGLAVQLIDGLDQLLRAEHLGGVQAAVDPDDRLAVPRELPRLVVGQPFGQREPAVDVLVAAPAGVWFSGEVMIAVQLGPPFCGLADVDDRHAGRIR